jgi:hypothetical protein
MLLYNTVLDGRLRTTFPPDELGHRADGLHERTLSCANTTVDPVETPPSPYAYWHSSRAFPAVQ